MYRAVPARISFADMDREIISFWNDQGIFEASLAKNAGGPRWVFYEGPPTANGKPGTHHIEARVFKDVFPRFKTMKGWHVPRKAGWDCHGLPVELAIEKELGFAGKADIEEYGIAEFNAKCRESVLHYVGEFKTLTERVGYWVNMDDAYFTMDSSFVQSVWWSLQQIFNKGLLVQDHRVTPYCPRCGTGLSDHELGQDGGYETIVDQAVYVRMPVAGGDLAERFPGLCLLVWTTTPWTLVSNTACAVHRDLGYSVVVTAEDTRPLVIATERIEQVLGEDHRVLATVTGEQLLGLPYQRPLDWIDFPDAADALHTILHADFVTADEGSGVVHEAPAFGAEDLDLCRRHGLPVVNPIGGDGRFMAHVPMVGGMTFKESDAVIAQALADRGLLVRADEYEHSYPHCWRCHSALMYYAQPSWYIRTTAIKEELLRENGHTNWHPPTIQWGRFGDWLHNNVDWALSRNRYWGTPLPIWRCPDNHLTCIGSLAELGALAGRDLDQLDPHRPHVDDVVFDCPQCGGIAARVPEVIDCWYDSGSMPFAQFGYPHANIAEFEASYPANFIAEAIDQTRGWFYTLMAVGTLVHNQSSYRDVLCLGHLVDDQGRKMSKHLGNVLEPIGLLDQHGADAVRWFMLASGSPWQARRVGHAAITDIVRRVLLTYWNTVSFHTLYANAAGFSPDAADIPVQQRHVMDRWLLAETTRVAAAVDAAMERYETQAAGALIATLIDDMSNWYVRRSRRRFWDGDPAALQTLHECLRTVTVLMAPMMPFITERVWQDLVASTDPTAARSIHLADWPVRDGKVAGGHDDAALVAQMALTRTLVELGRAARATAGLKTRQPLASALVTADGFEQLGGELLQQLSEELNVVAIVDGRGSSDLVEVTVKANFRSLGARHGKQTPAVAQAIGALAGEGLAAFADQLRSRGSASINVGGQQCEVLAGDVFITEVARAGWAVATDTGISIALDTDVTPELRQMGIMRDVVRVLQEGRKSAGFDISDRINVSIHSADPDIAAAINAYQEAIAVEVLAVTWETASSPVSLATISDEDLRLTAALAKVDGR